MTQPTIFAQLPAMPDKKSREEERSGITMNLGT